MQYIDQVVVDKKDLDLRPITSQGRPTVWLSLRKTDEWNINLLYWLIKKKDFSKPVFLVPLFKGGGACFKIYYKIPHQMTLTARDLKCNVVYATFPTVLLELKTPIAAA